MIHMEFQIKGNITPYIPILWPAKAIFYQPLEEKYKLFLTQQIQIYLNFNNIDLISRHQDYQMMELFWQLCLHKII